MNLKILTLSLLSLSWDHARAFEQECHPGLTSVRAAIERLRVKAPEAVRQGAAVREAFAKVLKAQDRTNPVATFQGFRSSHQDPSGDSLQATIMFPTDVWGVRSSRKKRAEVDASATKLNQGVSEDQVSIVGYLAIVQIQLLDKSLANDLVQIRILKSTIQSYSKRPSLTPEQEAVLSTLEIALSDQEMKIEIDRQDQEGLVHDLSIMLGCSWTLNAILGVSLSHDWPKLQVENEKLNSSAHFARYSIMRQQAELEIELSNLELKPALSIGPAVEWTRIRDESGFRVGLALQMQLPLLDATSGHRAAAQAAASRLVDEAEAGTREIRGELEHSLEIYETASARIKSSQAQGGKFSRSQRMLKSFARGLVSGAMLLESLRSERERLASSLMLELRARAARCKVLAFQNQLEECYK